MSLAESEPAPKRMTAEEFLSLPDDGIERELIRGEVRIRGTETPFMTWRNPHHSQLEATVAMVLGVWRNGQPVPKGRIVSGEAGFRLTGDPKSSIVGVDVGYASAELVAATPATARAFPGPPTLAVEILSPSDKHGDVVEKVRAYLDVGTVVWVIDPDFQTVQVHRPGRVVETFNVHQTLDGEPELPGFTAAVSDFFQ